MNKLNIVTFALFIVFSACDVFVDEVDEQPNWPRSSDGDSDGDADGDSDSDSDGDSDGDADANEFPEDTSPSIEITDPDSTPSTFASGASEVPIVYMINVYETNSSHSFGNHPMGSATVNVSEQPVDIVLVLGSYEPVTWKLQGKGVARIKRLILHGYHQQIADGDDLSVPAEEYSYFNNSYIPSSYYWALPGDICKDDSEVSPEEYSHNSSVCRSFEVRDSIESLIGYDVDAFAGSYRATEFDVFIEKKK